MEKHNFVREGVRRLPPGFRFQPTDEELVFQYLKCKIFSLPLPASIIPELHFSNFDPWDLPGDPEEERYFFSKKEAKYRRGKRANRATRCGYWKATGSDKQITPSPVTCTQNLDLGMPPMKGLRKTLVFHKGRSPNGRRTHWFMHEFSLLLNDVSPTSHPMINSFHYLDCNITCGVEEWVICCVFLKQRVEKEEHDETMLDYGGDNNYGLTRSVNYNMNDDYFNRTGIQTTFSNSSSSSSSNFINESSSNDLAEEEESCSS